MDGKELSSYLELTQKKLILLKFPLFIFSFAFFFYIRLF